MKTHKTSKPVLHADAAYENSHVIARDLIEHINELLQDMPAPGNDDRPIEWAHVTQINRVNGLLLDIVKLMTTFNN